MIRFGLYVDLFFKFGLNVMLINLILIFWKKKILKGWFMC